MNPWAATEVDKIDLGDGLWVEIKREMDAGDQEDLEDYMLSLQMQDGKRGEVHLRQGKLKLLELNIVAWNLKQGGVDIPISAVNLSKLSRPVASLLIQEVQKRNPPLALA